MDDEAQSLQECGRLEGMIRGLAEQVCQIAANRAAEIAKIKQILKLDGQVRRDDLSQLSGERSSHWRQLHALEKLIQKSCCYSIPHVRESYTTGMEVDDAIVGMESYSKTVTSGNSDVVAVIEVGDAVRVADSDDKVVIIGNPNVVVAVETNNAVETIGNGVVTVTEEKDDHSGSASKEPVVNAVDMGITAETVEVNKVVRVLDAENTTEDIAGDNVDVVVETDSPRETIEEDNVVVVIEADATIETAAKDSTIVAVEADHTIEITAKDSADVIVETDNTFVTMRFTYEGRAYLLQGSIEFKREGIGVHAFEKLVQRTSRNTNLLMNKNYSKLSSLYRGFVQIRQKVGQFSYNLSLPPTFTIHPTFHVSKLKKRLGQGAAAQADLPRTLDVLVVVSTAVIDRHMGQRGNRTVTQVLIQWNNDTKEEATWKYHYDIKHGFPDLAAGWFSRFSCRAPVLMTREGISIPMRIIHAGSDKSLVWTVLGVRDPISAAIAIVKGGLTDTDVFSVEWLQTGAIHLGMTVSYYGFVSDVLELSEKYQKRFGPLSYFVAGFLNFLCMPTYNYELEFLPALKEKEGKLSPGRSNVPAEPEVIHPHVPLSTTPNWPRTRSKSRTDRGWSGMHGALDRQCGNGGINDKEDISSTMSDLGPIWDAGPKWDAEAHGDVENPIELPGPSDDLEAKTKKEFIFRVEEKWEFTNGQFLDVLVCNHACRTVQSSQVVAPKAEHDDSALDLILLRGNGEREAFEV